VIKIKKGARKMGKTMRVLKKRRRETMKKLFIAAIIALMAVNLGLYAQEKTLPKQRLSLNSYGRRSFLSQYQKEYMEE